LSQKASDLWGGSNTTLKRELLETLSLSRAVSDVSLCITKRKPFDILAERPKTSESRGDCHSFEPLLNTFLDILTNNNAELQLIQELARKYA
jgi:hypothetical protein